MSTDSYELTENWDTLYDMLKDESDFDEELFTETAKATFHCFFDDGMDDDNKELLLSVHKFALHPISVGGFVDAAKLVAQNLCDQYASGRIGASEDDDSIGDPWEALKKYFFIDDEINECLYKIDVDKFDITEIIDNDYKHFI